jgi:hypothetical protein
MLDLNRERPNISLVITTPTKLIEWSPSCKAADLPADDILWVNVLMESIRRCRNNAVFVEERPALSCARTTAFLRCCEHLLLKLPWRSRRMAGWLGFETVRRYRRVDWSFSRFEEIAGLNGCTRCCQL